MIQRIFLKMLGELGIPDDLKPIRLDLYYYF